MIDARVQRVPRPSVLLINVDSRRFAFRCGHCGGDGMSHARRLFATVLCKECAGVGFFGIDPFQPTTARLGTEARLAVLSARECVHIPLHNSDDSLETDVLPAGAFADVPMRDDDADEGSDDFHFEWFNDVRRTPDGPGPRPEDALVEPATADGTAAGRLFEN